MSNKPLDKMSASERRHLLREAEKDDRYWNSEYNKPKWLKEREKRENIGEIVLFIFSPEFLIPYLILTLIINYFW